MDRENADNDVSGSFNKEAVLLGCPEGYQEEILANWERPFQSIPSGLNEANPGEASLPTGWKFVDLVELKAGLEYVLGNGDVEIGGVEFERPSLALIALFELQEGEYEEAISVYNDLSVLQPRGKGDRVWRSIHDVYNEFKDASIDKNYLPALNFMKWYATECWKKWEVTEE
jgi:hypothetical protein